MIDRSKINGDKLIELLLYDYSGNYNIWRRMVEFVDNYIPPNPSPNTKPTRVSIKCGWLFLRHIGLSTFIWDIHCGEDSEFYSHENALLALMHAPIPHWMIDKEVFKLLKNGIKL